VRRTQFINSKYRELRYLDWHQLHGNQPALNQVAMHYCCPLSAAAAAVAWQFKFLFSCQFLNIMSAAGCLQCFDAIGRAAGRASGL